MKEKSSVHVVLSLVYIHGMGVDTNLCTRDGSHLWVLLLLLHRRVHALLLGGVRGHFTRQHLSLVGNGSGPGLLWWLLLLLLLGLANLVGGRLWGHLRVVAVHRHPTRRAHHRPAATPGLHCRVLLVTREIRLYVRLKSQIFQEDFEGMQGCAVTRII